MISVAQNCILQVRGSGFWQWQCWILQRVEKHRQLSCRASNICLCDVWMKRAPWVFKKQMFKLVRHNQPQACNFQKQPVAIPHLMGTEFQWQACFGLPSWLVYQFTSLSLKFSLSEDSFQFQVHSTVSKTRISGTRLLHKAHTTLHQLMLTCESHPTGTPFHRKCSQCCTHSTTLLTSHPMGTGPATFHGWYITASQKGGTSLCQVAGWPHQALITSDWRVTCQCASQNHFSISNRYV